jgi:hypothetical protein
MNSADTCSRCGVTLLSLSEEGLCSACMLRSVFEESGVDGATGPPPKPSLPRRFGAYELLDEIGRGGMGVVYRARQQTLDRIVALKLLLGGMYSSEAMLRRFQVEAAAAAALRHPGIVAIHDYGEFEGQPFYTMELMEGRNLAQVSDGRPLDPGRAARYLRAISDAVSYAHGCAILHRDLKPSNILVDHEDRARVADFGMAKRLDLDSGVTLTGQLVGSPNYAAPEQVSGLENDVGAATDIYALGALLYHLLTGRPPFLAATLEETLRLLYGTEPVAPRLLNPAVPRDLETICLKCMAKEPTRRYTSAAALTEDLDHFLNHRPINARPPSIVYRTWKYARRNRIQVIASGAVFSSLAIGLALALAGYRRAVEQQSATQAARAQAEELVGVIMSDVQPALEPYGRLPVMEKIAGASLNYFEQLPTELRNASTDTALATTLDSLAVVKMRRREGDSGRPALLRAKSLWEKVLAANPGDPDAAASLLLDDGHSIHWVVHPLWSDKVRMEADLIARYRKWCGRFPTHLRLKYGLAESLVYWSFDAGHVDGMEKALAGAQEAHGILKNLIGQMPGDVKVQVIYLLSYVALIATNPREDAKAENILLGEEAVAFAGERLQRDPGNLALIEGAAQASTALSIAFGPVSARRAYDAGLAARDYLRALVQFDPANRAWRFAYAKSFMGEADFLQRDGQLAKARSAYMQIETQMLALGDLSQQSEAEGPGGPKAFILGACFAQAECAARMGEIAEADASLAKAATWCDDLLSGPDDGNPGGANYVRALLWLARIQTANNLRDWARLARVADEAIRAIDAMPAASTAKDLALFRAQAVRAQGTAKLRQGDAIAAVPLLPGDDETLAEALIASGDSALARKLLAPILATQEGDFAREPELWETKVNLARTSCLFAKALDAQKAEDRVRRKALLDRASNLLSDPEAETRLTPADRDLKATIAAL